MPIPKASITDNNIHENLALTRISETFIATAYKPSHK